MAADQKERINDAIVSNNLEEVYDALEMGPSAKKKFKDLLDALGSVMDFPLTAPAELEAALGDLKMKIDTEFVHILNLTMPQIVEFKAYLSQVSYYLGEKQAEAEGRSTQMQYCRYLKEAGVNFALSKHGRTLAERIAKCVTNPDKEAIGRMQSVHEYKGEVHSYAISQRLKNILQAMQNMQRTLDTRYQLLYKEWTLEEERKNQPPDGRRHNSQFQQ